MLNLNFLIDRLINREIKEKDITVDPERAKLIQAINDVQNELEEAKMFFNNQNEDGLLEYAIHRENAAKARYSHYINKLKEIENRNRNKVG